MYKEKIITMRIIAGALCMGILIFGAIVITGIDESSRKEDEMMTYVVAGVLIMSFFSGYFVGNTILDKITGNESLNERFLKAQTALIIRLANLEGAALFSLVMAMINNNTDFLMGALVALGGMISYFPFQARIIKDLKLRGMEIKEVFN